VRSKKKTPTTTAATMQTSIRIPVEMMAEIDKIASSGLVKAQRTDVMIAALRIGLPALLKKGGRS
jgi:hypothetical protein